MDFSEKEINIFDDIPLDLITELFSKKQDDFHSVVKSLVFLNFVTLNHSIYKYEFDEILCAIDNVYAKLMKKHQNIKNVKNMSLFVEKSITMFVDEIRRPKNKEKKKRNTKELKKDGNSTKKDKDNTIEDNSTSMTKIINLDEERIHSEPSQKAVKIIKSVDIQHDSNSNRDNLNQLGNINKYINNIINYIKINNMGNESINNDLKGLRNEMKNIIDKNEKL